MVMISCLDSSKTRFSFSCNEITPTHWFKLPNRESCCRRAGIKSTSTELLKHGNLQLNVSCMMNNISRIAAFMKNCWIKLDNILKYKYLWIGTPLHNLKISPPYIKYIRSIHKRTFFQKGLLFLLEKDSDYIDTL